MTIFNPDGSEVAEIILPDGTQASQVVGPDGTVLWSAGGEIPDSGVLHAWYDFSDYDTSVTSDVPDLSDNGYDLTTGSFTGYTDINGVQAAEFDGTGDELRGPTFSDIRPATVHVVANHANSSGFENIHSVGETELLDLRWNGDNWSVWDGGEVVGSSDNTRQLFTVIYGSGGEIVIRENGQETAVQTESGRAFDAIGLGARNLDTSPERFWDGAIGEWFVYPTERSSTEIDEAEQYLADKWGVSLS